MFLLSLVAKIWHQNSWFGRQEHSMSDVGLLCEGVKRWLCGIRWRGVLDIDYWNIGMYANSNSGLIPRGIPFFKTSKSCSFTDFTICNHAAPHICEHTKRYGPLFNCLYTELLSVFSSFNWLSPLSLLLYVILFISSDIFPGCQDHGSFAKVLFSWWYPLKQFYNKTCLYIPCFS